MQNQPNLNQENLNQNVTPNRSEANFQPNLESNLTQSPMDKVKSGISGILDYLKKDVKDVASDIKGLFNNSNNQAEGLRPKPNSDQKAQDTNPIITNNENLESSQKQQKKQAVQEITSNLQQKLVNTILLATMALSGGAIADSEAFEAQANAQNATYPSNPKIKVSPEILRKIQPAINQNRQNQQNLEKTNPKIVEIVKQGEVVPTSGEDLIPNLLDKTLSEIGTNLAAIVVEAKLSGQPLPPENIFSKVEVEEVKELSEFIKEPKFGDLVRTIVKNTKGDVEYKISKIVGATGKQKDFDPSKSIEILTKLSGVNQSPEIKNIDQQIKKERQKGDSVIPPLAVELAGIEYDPYVAIFAKAIGEEESGSDYNKTNGLKCRSRYQFCPPGWAIIGDTSFANRFYSLTPVEADLAFLEAATIAYKRTRPERNFKTDVKNAIIDASEKNDWRRFNDLARALRNTWTPLYPSNTGDFGNGIGAEGKLDNIKRTILKLAKPSKVGELTKERKNLIITELGKIENQIGNRYYKVTFKGEAGKKGRGKQKDENQQTFVSVNQTTGKVEGVRNPEVLFPDIVNMKQNITNVGQTFEEFISGLNLKLTQIAQNFGINLTADQPTAQTTTAPTQERNTALQNTSLTDPKSTKSEIPSTPKFASKKEQEDWERDFNPKITPLLDPKDNQVVQTKNGTQILINRSRLKPILPTNNNQNQPKVENQTLAPANTPASNTTQAGEPASANKNQIEKEPKVESQIKPPQQPTKPKIPEILYNQFKNQQLLNRAIATPKEQAEPETPSPLSPDEIKDETKSKINQPNQFEKDYNQDQNNQEPELQNISSTENQDEQNLDYGDTKLKEYEKRIASDETKDDGNGVEPASGKSSVLPIFFENR
jgi:hypothetical protein